MYIENWVWNFKVCWGKYGVDKWIYQVKHIKPETDKGMYLHVCFTIATTAQVMEIHDRLRKSKSKAWKKI